MGDKIMKQYKLFVTIFLIAGITVCLLSSLPSKVFASDSQEELIKRVEEALDVSVFHLKETEPMIKCFDVNEAGWYAIGFNNNTIHIYDSSGAFQYGYRFSTDVTYGIDLKGNNIVIYLGRSHYAVEIDPKGKCISGEEVFFSSNFVDNVLRRTKKQTGNVTYNLERDIGIFGGYYSRLVKNDENGNKMVLYDVTTKGYFTGVFHYMFISIFPICGIACYYQKIKEEEKSSDEVLIANDKHKHESVDDQSNLHP